MGERQSDEYAEFLTAAKLEQLLEGFYRSESGDFASAREVAEHLVLKTVGCEFLISKGQVRLTLDLRPAEQPAPQPGEPGYDRAMDPTFQD